MLEQGQQTRRTDAPGAAAIMTESRLADGRELIYFDDPGSPPRAVPVDHRDLAGPPEPAALRHDPLSGEWITYATHRQTRTFMPPPDQCPLCPSVGGRQTEIPATDYDVAVFENRFPSFPALVDPTAANGLDPAPGSPVAGPVPHGGRCEVVSFTAAHTGSFAGLTARRARTVVDAWAERTRALSAQDGVEQVFVFENRGVEIGVTLSHPHGQIYAYPYVAPTLAAQLERARAHRAATGRNLFADVLAAEVADGRRVIVRSPAWTVFVPAAARWPIEVHVYPNRQVADLAGLDDRERDDLARVYLETLRRVEGVFGAPIPYIAGWYQAPVGADRDLGYLHLQLSSPQRTASKLKYLAGSETAMGAFINDVLPEDTADRLRAATIDRSDLD